MEEQTCTVARALGTNDEGKIKIEPNKDYNLYLGTKIYHVHDLKDIRRTADATDPIKFMVSYEKNVVVQDEAIKMAAATLTSIALLAANMMF